MTDTVLEVEQAELLEVEHQRANEAEQTVELERQRADRLAAKLRELGVDPDPFN